jgi:TetR/AcrR family transcriptional regulator, mexJK operon transcriptional repressor
VTKTALKQRLNTVERKQAMLAAARELFLEKGYAATSLDDVVARSGGSLATLYQLFGNKEGLWQQLVRTYSERIVEPMAQADLSDDHHARPPREVLREVAARLMALKTNPDSWAGICMVMSERQKSPDLARMMYENGPLTGICSLARYFSSQVEAGTLDIPDVNLAALLFCNLVIGEHQMWSACGIDLTMTQHQLDKYIDETVRIFLAGYERKS